MARRIRFGTFEFDADTYDLRREGSPVHLQAQPKLALATLLAHAGRTVSRDELREALWGADTHVDFDRGLNFCIAQVRAALGDDETRPVYVRTVARLGYQFIAPVERVDEPAAGRPGSSPAWRPSRRFAFGLASFTAVLAVLGTYRLLTRPPAAPIVAVVRFDNETGDPAFARFADALTDNVVARLTTLGGDQIRVIGNAKVLREPRDGRDLTAIARALRARFVVLGQVQSSANQTRVLAHLIRMPEQTHIGVERIERHVTNPLDVEADVAEQVARDFSRRLAASRD